MKRRSSALLLTYLSQRRIRYCRSIAFSQIIWLFIQQTSHATQWALYLLSRNPDCQQKILDEINSVTGGDIVEEKHLSQLSYVKGVIKEALRYSFV